MHDDFRNVHSGYNLIPRDRSLDPDSIAHLEQLVEETQRQLDELREKMDRLEAQMARMERKTKFLAALCLIASGLSLLVAFL